jgi:hypothetical protein
LRRARLAIANFDGGGHQRFVMDAPALAARASADPRFIDFDMLFCPTSDTVLIRPHHNGAQFMQDTEGGFVSCQPKLPLELHRRHAWRLTGDEIGGPKPDTEWRMTALHDGAGQEAGLPPTRTALQNAGSVNNAEGLANQTTMRADKTIGPPGTPVIRRASRVIRRQLLKFGERLGESQIVSLLDVHNRHDVNH